MSSHLLSCVAAIDQGTSSTRVLIITSQGQILSSHQVEHTQYYPAPGQVEHDPLEIWNCVKLCLSEAIAPVRDKVKICSIGITNQRETTIVWNKHTGAPYSRAIVWNDTRTASISDELAEQANGNRDRFRAKTGLPLASYFSATKLIYLMRAIPGLRDDAKSGDALFGTIDTWILWKLTNGKSHATDVSNASRTLLMNLEATEWDDEILQELDIPRSMLPNIYASSHNFGFVDTMPHDEFADHDMMVTTTPGNDKKLEMAFYADYHDVPITGILGDQSAALFGQACFHPGDAKCTYGTGAFLLMNTGNEIIHSKNGLLTTVAYQLAHKNNQPGNVVYALEGSIAYSGSVLQWLRDNMEMIKGASETEAIARSVPDSGGVYFVPAFAGLYAPYWRGDARGLIAGLTAYNTKAHIVRAALEASAYQLIEVAHAMEEDCEHRMPINQLRVDGGMSVNSLIMQFQADVLDKPLVRPVIRETTGFGAAFIAGLGVGLWAHQEDIQALWRKDEEWHPSIPVDIRDAKIAGWKKAVQRSMGWVEKIEPAQKRTQPKLPPNLGSKAGMVNRRFGAPLVVAALGVGVGTGYFLGKH